MADGGADDTSDKEGGEEEDIATTEVCLKHPGRQGREAVGEKETHKESARSGREMLAMDGGTPDYSIS